MTRWFPIIGGPAIPWSMIAPHERQARENHDQSLERLAQRGGLGPYEACLVLEDRKLGFVGSPHKELTDEEWLTRLRKHVRVDLTAKLEQLRESHPPCSVCTDEPAVCFGAYESPVNLGFACGNCCAHGNEDGWCKPLSDRSIAEDLQSMMMQSETFENEVEKRAVEVRYFKELARLWEVACHDYRARIPERVGDKLPDPESYSRAVEFAKERARGKR